MHSYKEKKEFNKLVWAVTRSLLESDKYKRKKNGKKTKSHWDFFTSLLEYFTLLLRLIGYYHKGLKNAKNLEINRVDFSFSELPEELEGFTILHLSDLHIDTLPGLEDIIIDQLKTLPADLLVITGDYRKETKGEYRQVMEPIRKIVESARVEYGKLAILGNHDSWIMVEELEKTGLKLLINESIIIETGDKKILITGTDDPYYYFTDQIYDSFSNSDFDFKIALVHTSELYNMAADNNYQLYLCGHTHGGQICLPEVLRLLHINMKVNNFLRGNGDIKVCRGIPIKDAELQPFLSGLIVPVRLLSSD